MQYFLNGGRDERGVLTSDEALQLYAKLGVQHVLFIVYALREEAWQQFWHKSGSLIAIPERQTRSLTIYETDPKVIAEAIAWADFIYFPGGAQAALLTRMHDLSTQKILADNLASSDLKLLGGGSAGAMVMGSWCIVGHTIVKKVVPGLGYLSGYVVDSHFSQRQRQSRLQAVIQDLPAARGLGLDENTAALINSEEKLQAVYGPGTVTVYDSETTIYDKNHAFTN